MVGAVDQLDLDVDHREAGEHARAQHRVQALLDAGDVLLRHRAADDLRFEREAGARLVRLDDELHAGELAGTAGLLLVRVVDLLTAGQLLAVGHLRLADIRVDLVGPAQDVDLDVEVELAHPA